MTCLNSIRSVIKVRYAALRMRKRREAGSLARQSAFGTVDIIPQRGQKKPPRKEARRFLPCLKAGVSTTRKPMSETTHLGSTTLAQVAIVVHDIEAAAQRYADILGLPVPNIITTAPGQEVEQTYRGQASNAQAKLAFFNLGQVQLELIEPLGGESTWQEALDKNGEGVHHLAFWVEGMQRSVDFLKEKDIPMIQRGDMGEGQYAYFDTEKPLGVVLELLEHKRESRAAG